MGQVTEKGWYKRTDGVVCWACEQDGEVYGFRKEHLESLQRKGADTALSALGFYPMAPRYVNAYTFYATQEEAAAHQDRKPWDPQETDHG